MTHSQTTNELRERKDYTLEIIRCIEFIVSQLRRNLKVKDIILQAEQSYGYKITLNAQRAIHRNI